MSKSGPIRMAMGPIIRRLKNNINHATTLAELEIPSDSKEARTLLNDVEVMSAKLTASVTSLDERDKQWTELIMQIDDAAAEETVYAEKASGVGGYIELLEDGKELINILDCKQKQIERDLQTLAASSSSSGNLTTPNQSVRRSTTAKLPRLELPSFSGNTAEWQHFWTVFAANVDSTDLTGVEKFSYLRSRLQGPAMDAIGGLPVTDDAYKVAVDILKDRFHRSPEQLVCNLYGQLKRLSIASNNVADLRRTFDACEKILRQLKDAGEDINSNRSLVLDIWSKYPEQVITQLTHQKAVSVQSTLSQIQEAIKSYIEESDSLSGMLQDLQPFHRESSSNSVRNRKFEYHRSNSNQSSSAARANQQSSGWSVNNYSSALVAPTFEGSPSSDSRSEPPASPCYFCGNQHFNSQCDCFQSAEERLKQLAVVGRCQRCMDSSHVTNNCRTYPSRIRCHFCRSIGVHVSALCPAKFSAKPTFNSHATSNVRNTRGKPETKPKSSATSFEKSETSNVAMTKDQSQSPLHTMCGLSVHEQALLSTAVTTIRNPETGSERSVRVILDNGCPRTFILNSIAEELGLKSNPTRNLYISSFGCKRTVNHPSQQVQFEMCLRDGQVMTIESNTVELIVNRSAQPDLLPSSTQRITETMGGAMADNLKNQGPPELLIGSDYFWQLITCNRMTTEDGIFLIPSSLGLLLGGRFQTYESSEEYPAMLCLTEQFNICPIETNLSAISTVSSLRHPYPDIDEFWDLERIGISDDPVEDDDEVAQRQFDESVQFENGRYQVTWPWKANQHLLPTNYPLAFGRLRSLCKRLSTLDDAVSSEYDKTIQNQLQLGIIEKVPSEELVTTPNTVHYLPHHPVVRASHNTTKVRIVYDASSKCRKDQMSLNECLYRGPVILPDLCEILIRFRLNTVAIVADIEKAFLQLGLEKSQRDVTRFLWLKDPTKRDVADNIEVYRFKRVPFGAISSPFLLGATLQHHLKQVDSGVAMNIRSNIYVDNLITGTKTDSEAVALYDEAKAIFNEAHMNLREWCSNSSILQYHIPDVDKCATSTVKVLGLAWDSLNDSIQLQDHWTEHNKCCSKRTVLKAIASIYDPLGLFQPCTLKAKQLLRDLWENELGWDDDLETKYRLQWEIIHTDIAPIFGIKIPRQVNYSDKDSDVCLAVFSDASKDAYATAIYLRTRVTRGSTEWRSNLIYSKSRLTPKKQMKSISLPRLELLGLTIGIRAAAFVRTSLQRQQTVRCYIFCDSVCVLSWIRTEKPLQRFVGNRVKQVRALENAEYHHVSSAENPADLCTRGLTGEEISNSSFWWHGPRWLTEESSKWPTNKPIEQVSDADFMKETKLDSSLSLLVGEGQDTETNQLFDIDVSDFSSLRKLLRLSTRCVKFLKVLWNRISKKTQDAHPKLTHILSTFSDSDDITANDLAHTKILLVKRVQSNNFADVIAALESNTHHQLMKQLNLQIDSDGLVRCFGRLTNAELPRDAITPVLLPKNVPLTDLIIAEIHQRLFHSGTSHTLSQLRRQYWVPQGRNAVRRVVGRCVVCRKQKGPPVCLA